MPPSEHPDYQPEAEFGRRPSSGAREDGLRRLSTLTVTAAVAAAAATGVISLAAYHGSTSTAPSSAGAGTADSTDSTDQLQGPAEIPRRGDGAPAGVSSGS